MIIIEFIFWISFVLFFYAFIGYPAFLWVLSRIMHDPVKREDITPSVSLVISAYNEEHNIGRKIENSLDIDYPKSLLEIAVISDGSTDRTNDIIMDYAKRDGRILPFIVPSNKGKSACLNDVVPGLRGEIVLFSDANSFYERDLIRNIVRPFADGRIGFVTGFTKYVAPVSGRTTETASLYSKLEKFTKILESRIGSCVGADGAVFAIRTTLFWPMRSSDINDLVTPFQIVRRRFRGVLEESAFCHEMLNGEIKGEFRRQARITNRTLRALFNYWDLLNPLRYPLFSFQLISHKLLKYMMPFYIILIFLSNGALVFTHIFYAFTLGIQLFCYVLIYFGYRGEKKKKSNRLSQVAYVFALMGLAMLKGWLTHLSGKTYSTWPQERA